MRPFGSERLPKYERALWKVCSLLRSQNINRMWLCGLCGLDEGGMAVHGLIETRGGFDIFGANFPKMDIEHKVKLTSSFSKTFPTPSVTVTALSRR